MKTSMNSDETMMLTTPFHSRIAAACELNCWGSWAGYTTPNAYTDVELEYFAIRSATGVFDLSPMNKYGITGPDAEAYLKKAEASMAKLHTVRDTDPAVTAELEPGD